MAPALSDIGYYKHSGIMPVPSNEQSAPTTLPLAVTIVSDYPLSSRAIGSN